LAVAELLGVDRGTALQGMYDAPPDPGVLSVERYRTPEGKKLRFANVFAANDPESTLMNINQLLDLGAIHRPLNVVINCRPDRVERNGQMGEIIPDLDPERVFVIGHPAKSAIDAIPAEFRSRAVDLGGDKRDPEEFMGKMLDMLGPDSSMVAIGNIHGQGEILLEHLAELPPDDSADEPVAAAPAAPAGRTETAPAAVDPSETMQLYAPRIDPYQHYSEAYESRYAQHQQPYVPQLPGQRDSAHPHPHQEPVHRTGHEHAQSHGTWTDPQPDRGGRPLPALPQAPADSGRAADAGQPRGLFEPRVPPQPSADDSQQWHSPGEQR
ncbi:poly-gamma-glutamate synthase PgsB, partial [Streptomyces sp. NPDC049099]